MERTYRGGYAGLVTLLVSVAIIAMVFAGMYLNPEKVANPNAEFQPMTASGTVPQSGMEQMHADVDAAKAVQEELNHKNKETQFEIDQSL